LNEKEKLKKECKQKKVEEVSRQKGKMKERRGKGKQKKVEEVIRIRNKNSKKRRKDHYYGFGKAEKNALLEKYCFYFFCSNHSITFSDTYL
jgi:hypothetical protein